MLNWVPCSKGFNRRGEWEKRSPASFTWAIEKTVIMFICEKCGAGEQRLHDVIFVKRLQGPAATLPERLGLVAPGFGVCGCPGTQFIREICVRQTNPTPRACLSHGTECRMPTDQSLWEQMLLAEQQLYSDPVHTLPVCSGLPGGYYVPNRVMTAPLPPLLPTVAAALRGGCTGARLAVCLRVLIVSFGGADSGLDTPWLVLW